MSRVKIGNEMFYDVLQLIFFLEEKMMKNRKTEPIAQVEISPIHKIFEEIYKLNCNPEATYIHRSCIEVHFGTGAEMTTNNLREMIQCARRGGFI